MSTATKAATAEDITALPPRGFAGFIAKFTVLRGARRELWLTFLIKFLIYTAYSVTNKTLVLWIATHVLPRRGDLHRRAHGHDSDE